MRKLFGSILERAIIRKVNTLRLMAKQHSKVKLSHQPDVPYSKCSCCGVLLNDTEAYGSWEDFCIDCYLKEDSKEK